MDRGGLTVALRPYDRNVANPMGDPAAANPAVTREIGKQIAIATLVSGSHQIDDRQVTFYAEADRSGNALQQFAEVFGQAIAEGENPRPLRAPLRQSKGGM